jgi:chromosomal replication initiator protein
MQENEKQNRSELNIRTEQTYQQQTAQPDMRQIWQTALRSLQNQVERTEYDYWLRNLVLMSIENGVARLVAPSSSARQRLETQYRQVVQQALTGVLGVQLTVQFTTEQLTNSNESMALKIPVGVAIRNSSNGIKSTNDFGKRPNNQVSNNPLNRVNGATNGYTNNRPEAYLGFNTSNENNLEQSYPLENSEIDDDEITNNYSKLSGFQTDQYGNVTNHEGQTVPRSNNNLNPKYVFDKFIVGNSNRVTYSAARSVADNPGFHYNPLFIYGGVGLGKTHLLHAIGHEAIRQQPNLRALYVTSEKFTNDMVEAIRFRRNEEFRNRYRNTDILMIDDIQFIAGKESSQEEFFHTFNALYSENRQIIICSDRPPKAMLVLEDRLRSRFEGGFITDIDRPDYEMRLAILQAKAEYQPLPIPMEVLDYIAGKMQTNIRELEGALTRVVGYALHSRSTMTIDIAKQALEEILQNTRRKIVTPEGVIETVSQFFNIDTKELKGRSRSADIVLPRQIAMYIIREHTESSLVEVGQAFGGRDHTTVMHGYDKIQREIETNTQLRQQVNTITQILYSESRS